MTRKDGPISDDELDGLFGHLSALPLALAVSGGADSMALMHLIARWAAREDVKARWSAQCRRWLERRQYGVPEPMPIDWRGLGVPSWLKDVRGLDEIEPKVGLPHVVVLTVDHGLRPESAYEAAFVADAAARLGLPCEVLRWVGEKPRSGLQEAARNARRELMLDVLRAECGRLMDLALAGSGDLWRHLHNFRCIVMAHHEDDQAETVLMRLARGSGLEGLAGMRAADVARREATRDRPTRFAARVRRPFLGLAKSRLVATLEHAGQAWAEDPSNEDDRFERVRMRKALRELAGVGISAAKISLSARRLAEANVSFAVLKSRRASESDGYLVYNALYSEQSLRDVVFKTRYLAAQTLHERITAYGGSARAPELAQLEDLAARLLNVDDRAGFGGVTLGGCKIELVGNHRDRVRIYREGCGVGLPVVPMEPGRLYDWDGRRYLVYVGPEFRPGAALGPLGLAGWADLKRAVPHLDSLRWPAAAAATMPAVVRDGGIVDVPHMDFLLTGPSEKLRRALASWRAYQSQLESGVVTVHVGAERQPRVPEGAYW